MIILFEMSLHLGKWNGCTISLWIVFSKDRCTFNTQYPLNNYFDTQSFPCIGVFEWHYCVRTEQARNSSNDLRISRLSCLQTGPLHSPWDHYSCLRGRCGLQLPPPTEHLTSYSWFRDTRAQQGLYIARKTIGKWTKEDASLSTNWTDWQVSCLSWTWTTYNFQYATPVCNFFNLRQNLFFIYCLNEHILKY